MLWTFVNHNQCYILVCQAFTYKRQQESSVIGQCTMHTHLPTRWHTVAWSSATSRCTKEWLFTPVRLECHIVPWTKTFHTRNAAMASTTRRCIEFNLLTFHMEILVIIYCLSLNLNSWYFFGAWDLLDTQTNNSHYRFDSQHFWKLTSDNTI